MKLATICQVSYAELVSTGKKKSWGGKEGRQETNPPQNSFFLNFTSVTPLLSVFNYPCHSPFKHHRLVFRQVSQVTVPAREHPGHKRHKG